MQIRLEDAIPFQATDVLYLNDQLIRFQLECPRRPAAYQRYFMCEYSSAENVSPGTADHNLASLTKKLDVAFALLQDRPFVGDWAITSRKDLLSFYIDHFCRPVYLYTNGQAIVSLVPRNATRFEVVYHPSLHDFNGFDSEFEQLSGVPISTEHVRIANTFEAAEQDAIARLSILKTRVFCLHKGDELDALVLQPAGSRTTASGYKIQTLIGSFRGNRFLVQMGGPPCGPHEPYRVLNELRPEGFIIEACATCQHFRFSRMSRDMSAGSTGYCTLPSQTNTAPSFRTNVSVRHSCPAYALVADQERRCPYLSWSTEIKSIRDSVNRNLSDGMQKRL